MALNGWMKNCDYITDLAPFTGVFPTPSFKYLCGITLIELLSALVIYPPKWTCVVHLSGPLCPTLLFLCYAD